jgi:hypothetical protein
VVAAVVALAGVVILVAALVVGSAWWLLGLGLAAVAALVSVAAQLRLRGQKTPH